MGKEIEPGLVSVVIANYNRCDDLRLALRTVAEQDYQPVEVIVVDNASTDGSVEVVRREFPSVCLMPLKENRGMDGYSVGFAQARGEFIFQMDNDSYLQDQNILSELARRFHAAPPNVAAAATRVEQYNGDPTTIAALRARDSRRGPFDTGGFPGAVAFRAQPLHAVGYYNRDVFLYGSEVFLEMKFLAAGFHIYYYPEIMTLHKASTAARSPLGLYYDMRNHYWILRRFAGPSRLLAVLPSMILQDFAYACYKRAPSVFVRALRDGLGPLPASIRPPLRSREPGFVAKLDEICDNFGFGALARRIVRRLGPAKQPGPTG